MQQILSSYMSDTVLVSGETAVTKTEKNPCRYEAYILMGEDTGNEQNRS